MKSHVSFIFVIIIVPEHQWVCWIYFNITIQFITMNKYKKQKCFDGSNDEDNKKSGGPFGPVFAPVTSGDGSLIEIKVLLD